MRLPTLLMFVALAAAQQASEPPKQARIEGSVVSVTGEPVPRAQVRLVGAPSLQNGQVVQASNFTATTDDAGKFAIEEIEPGSAYQLTAQRPGFVNARYGARSATGSGVPLSLEAGQSLKGLTIPMTPQGVISGRVTDAAGDPVQAAMVAVLRRGYQRGVRQLVPAGSASTNDQGEFRVANLTPGRYYLMSQGRSLLAALTSTGGAASATGPIATYYPNGTEPRDAAPIDIAAGQELRGMDIRLLQGKLYSIRGKVVDNGAAPPLGTTVLAIPRTTDTSVLASVNRAQSPVRAEGVFELAGLLPGAYILVAMSTQNGQSRPQGRMEVNITDAPLTGLVLPMTAPAIVSGSFRLDGGDIKSMLGPSQPASANTTASAALAAAAANAGAVISGVRPTVALAESTPPGLTTVAPAQPKDDGTFTMEGVGLTKYFLSIAALPAGVYVKSARFNGADVTHSEVDMTNGAGGTLEILLSNRAGNIVGAVRKDGDGSTAGYLVTLWTRDAEPGAVNNGVRTATTDQNGSFQFKNLAPGVYYAAAWEEIDNGLATVRAFVNLMTAEATKLEVTEGGNIAAEVKVVSAAKIKAAEEKLP